MRAKSLSFRFFTLIVFVTAILAAGSCSKEDTVTVPDDSGGYLMVYHEGDSTRVGFGGLTWFDADGEDAIQLNEFVDTTLIPLFDGYDMRPLHAYRIVGDDGFSASVKGYPDNTWEEMGLGHIMVATRNVIFPDDLIDLAGAYNVKETRRIFAYRKFDVETPDTALFYEVEDVAVGQVMNLEGQLEDAVSLADFVTEAVADPSSMSYNIVAVDGFGPDTDMTWEEFQTGYWLLETKRTIFTDPGLDSGRYKIKALERIEVRSTVGAGSR